MSQKQRNTISFQVKKEMIEMYSKMSNPSITDVADHFKVSRSAVSKIIKHKERILSEAEVNNNRKRKRGSKHTDIDEALFQWFSIIRQKDLSLSGDIFKAKAEKFAEDLGISDFKATEGWLWRWKSRYQIKHVNTHGEKKDADQEASANFLNNVLPGILERYDLEDIDNNDELGLYFKALPNGVYVRVLTLYRTL